MFKLGGSLLPLPDLGARVQSVLQQRPLCRPLMVVGGGAAVEVVREWDRLHHLGDELAHELAIKAMSSTAILAASRIEGARVVASLDEADSLWQGCGLPVLLVEPILAAAETQSGGRLPRSWEVTSDSIAAWLAVRAGASELVLLKSVDFPPAGMDAAQRDGSIDGHFPNLLETVTKITWVNLRAPVLHFVDCVRPVGAVRTADVQPA